MMKSSRTILLLSCACSVLLTGCESLDAAKKAKGNPVSLQALPASSSADDKIARLEQQVLALQKEVAASRPQIAKIDVIEQKFKDLSLGLDKIDATYSMKAAPAAAPAPVVLPTPAPVMAPPVVAAPKPVVASAPVPITPPPVKPVAVAPPPKPAEKPVEKKADAAPAEAVKPAGAKEVVNLRVGEQKDSTRLVLDLGQPVTVTSDIDNEEKILLIEIPGFAWKAPTTKAYPNSPLIASYQATSDASGTHLVVQLKKAAKVLNSGALTATKDKGPRAVVDIAAQ